MTRALFITTPFRLTALARSAGGTSSLTNACRAGESAIETKPPATPTATIRPTEAAPAAASPSRSSAAG